MQKMPNEITSINNADIQEFVTKKTRYAHKDCLTWHTPDGLNHAAVVSAEAVKRMILSLGTRGVYLNAFIQNAKYGGMILNYQIALNIFRQLRSGWYLHS